MFAPNKALYEIFTLSKALPVIRFVWYHKLQRFPKFIYEYIIWIRVIYGQDLESNNTRSCLESIFWGRSPGLRMFFFFLVNRFQHVIFTLAMELGVFGFPQKCCWSNNFIFLQLRQKTVYHLGVLKNKK